MKRSTQVDPNAKTSNQKCKLDKESLLYTSFAKYQCELDSRNDKYERLVKMSRDVTIQSKRLIFSLLRKEESVESLLEDGKKKIIDIKELLSKICDELKTEDPYKFAIAISPGIQEFIEAVTLMHFIENGKLISYDEVKELYFCFGEDMVLFTQYDFMLGVADLTGELMRMAINCIGSREMGRAENICQILRTIFQEFSIFAYENKELSRKIGVMRASMNKVEKACYNVQVRGSEIPDHMLADIDFRDGPDSGPMHDN